jgi:sigma-B regulation protein RsbU (phosphoserine phosphatase)
LIKRLYRDIEAILRRIDASLGAEDMLRATLDAIIESCTEEDGLELGRLYRDQGGSFELIASVGEYGEAILGKTVPRDYPVIKELEIEQLVMINAQTPGFDPAIESQFTHHDYAAILVGRNPEYIMSFGIRRAEDLEGHLHFVLESIRTAVGLKLRQASLEDQLRQARQIQMSLLPRILPEVPGFEIAAVSIPAEEVGGDVYDCQAVDVGTFGLTMADASGHGLPAALQARDVMTGLRMGIAQEQKINTTMSKLNRVIHQSGLVSRFVSVFYGELEESGNIVYVNGGHCPPLLFSTSGRVFELASTGPVLGPLPEAAYRRGYASLYPGEVLVLFTDGLLERIKAGTQEDHDPVEYGQERLIDTVQINIFESADDILHAIMGDVTVFGYGQAWEDDVTVMVIRRLPADQYKPKHQLDRVKRDRGKQHPVVRD